MLECQNIIVANVVLGGQPTVIAKMAMWSSNVLHVCCTPIVAKWLHGPCTCWLCSFMCLCFLDGWHLLWIKLECYEHQFHFFSFSYIVVITVNYCATVLQHFCVAHPYAQGYNTLFPYVHRYDCNYPSGSFPRHLGSVCYYALCQSEQIFSSGISMPIILNAYCHNHFSEVHVNALAWRLCISYIELGTCKQLWRAFR